LPFTKNLTRKQKIKGLLLLLALAALFLSLYLFTGDSRRFHALAEEMFLSELSGNTVSLHYTLAHPEAYGFDGPARLSSYEPGGDNGREAITSALDRLSGISPARLNGNDAYAYGLLSRYLTLRLSGVPFEYYDEPLSPSSGMQSGLPVLLADYTFRSPKDVEDYLHILEQTGSYFQGLIQYEKEKAQAGLFMSDTAAAQIVKQCGTIMDKEQLSCGSHFLHTTFRERLDALEEQGLATQAQKDQWISENDRLLTTVMLPAYEELADAFTILSGKGVNAMGLCHFPQGRPYYEYLLAATTGSCRSVGEIKAMLWEDFQAGYAALAELLREYPRLILMDSGTAGDFPFAGPEEMLEDLQERMAGDFPAFPASGERFIPSCTVKNVSPSLEDYSSPAYYLTPPIDDMRNNIIYINRKNSPDALTLYTTLAHEGYPGHLYQTVYSQLYMNQEKVSPIRYLLHYGGYTEGWALYGENLSYQYAQFLVQESDPTQAAWFEACRLNRNLQLCIYSLLDIAIHYDGADPGQVKEILQQIGITQEDVVSSIYQYIVEEPVNYLKYYLGFLEFLSLRETAQTLWGEKFTLMKFHQFVLEAGPSDFQGLNQRLSGT